MKTRSGIGRRHVLRGAAGAAIALPLLEAMRPVRAETGASGLLSARHGNRPRRFITVFVPNGTLKALWWPTGGETDFTLAPLMVGQHASDPARSLAPHRKDLLIFQGIDNKATLSGLRCTHQDGATLLTGWPLVGDYINSAVVGGASLDQEIGRLIDAKTPLKATTLQIGSNSGGRTTRLAQLGPGRPLANVDQPAELFRRLFGEARLDRAALEAQWSRRRSVLDEVKRDLEAISPQVSAEDRRRLDAHLDAIRITERRVALGNACAVNDPGYPRFDLYGETMPVAARAFVDTLALALSCDLSRVATITWRRAGGGSSYFPWLGLSKVYNEAEHHELTHYPNDPAKRERLVAIYSWFTEALCYLVNKLKTTADGEGTLFDTSLVLQVSECSDGAAHSKTNLPFLTVGNLGGVFRTGRFLSYPKVPHNDLLVSILRGFGSEATTFGDPKLGTGPLPNLT